MPSDLSRRVFWGCATCLIVLFLLLGSIAALALALELFRPSEPARGAVATPRVRIVRVK